MIANAQVDGAAAPERELLSYYFLLVVAGNETTRNAMTGGPAGLPREPRAVAAAAPRAGARRLGRRGDRALDDAGDPVLPHRERRRRDPRQEDPRGRQPVPVLSVGEPRRGRLRRAVRVPHRPRIRTGTSAFGIGEHFCLGANLARLELRVVFRHLAARLDECELAGPVERLRSSFVGGIKRMPIRYRLTA